MTKKEDIIAGFGELSMKDSKCSALQREIDLAGFQIFKCISDHGFYSFTPPRGSPSYKGLSGITTSEEITRYIDRDGKPDKLVQPLSRIRLPQWFLKLPPVEYKNKFPYGQQEIASLHVAVKDKNIDLSDIDFAFRGSTLEMLANCETKTPYLLTLIPGTQAIIVKKLDEYDVDFAHPAFQFQRLVTGKRLDDHSEVMDSVDHFQVMQVGKYRVLFFAGTDAVLGDDMTPVKVKASNPIYGGTKVLFQMIAGGCTKVCYGIKRKDRRQRQDQLTDVNLKSLSRVAKDALKSCDTSIEELERNIILGMNKMKDLSLVENSDYKVYFDEDKSLQVELMEDSTRTIFPSPSITHELIA